MKNETLIASIIGAGAAILAAFIGVSYGKNAEQKNIQNEINEAVGDVINIIGDDNNVTTNDIKDLVEEYQNLKSEKDSLVAQNIKYFEELEEAKRKIKDYENQSNSEMEELKQQLSDMPDVQFKDIGLSIDGDIIAINSTESTAIINNRTYYSDEFINNIINNISVKNVNISVHDNIMYIGKIIKEKSALTDSWLFEQRGASFESLVTDGRGITHTNVIELPTEAYVKYSLNEEYSFFRCNLNMKENKVYDGMGTVTIKADNVEVYKSPEFSKASDIDTGEIAINNCSILTIEYVGNSRMRCIISDAVVYN